MLLWNAHRKYSEHISYQGDDWSTQLFPNRLKLTHPSCPCKEQTSLMCEACQERIGLRRSFRSSAPGTHPSPYALAHAAHTCKTSCQGPLPFQGLKVTAGSNIFYLLITYLNSNGLSWCLAQRFLLCAVSPTLFSRSGNTFPWNLPVLKKVSVLKGAIHLLCRNKSM